MTDEQWFWSLPEGRAVRDAERSVRREDLLGPYASEAEAQHWRERIDARNEQWKEDDEEWTGELDGDDGDDDGDGPSEPRPVPPVSPIS